jgi:hypothetical protein
MKKKCLLKITMMILVCVTALIWSGAAQAAAEKAVVMKVSGTVDAMAPGAGWVKAVIGAQLPEGTKVRTGKDGEVFLRWSGENVIKIKALSIVELTKMQTDGNVSKSLIGLSQGNVFSKVKKFDDKNSSFEVKTPTAVAGVRGTGFDASFTPGQPTVFAVTEGTIVVEAGGAAIEVTEGMMSEVSEGMAPTEPAPAPPAELENLKNENEQTKEIVISEAPAPEETKPEAAAAPVPEAPAEAAQQATEDIKQNLDTVQQTIDTNTAVEEGIRATGNLEIIIH